MKLVISILLVFCATAFLFSKPIINEYCPVTPEERIDETLTTQYRGETIGFCCKRCLRKFNQNPQLYLDELPLESDSHSAEHNHDSHDHGDNEHDHATDHGETPVSFFSRILAFIGKLHVLLIHFPIAFLMLSGITQIIADFKKNEFLLKLTHLIFSIGSISAIFAATAGWIAASNSTYTGDLYYVLETHRWVGTLVAFFSLAGLICLLLAKKPIARIILRILILMPLVLVPLTAHFGGSLVYGTSFLKF